MKKLFLVIAVVILSVVWGFVLATQPSAEAQQRAIPPALINPVQQSCVFSSFTISSSTYTNIPGTVTFAVPTTTNVVITFSTEARTSLTTNRLDFRNAVSGVGAINGPEFGYNSNPANQWNTYTVRWVRSVAAGVRTANVQARIVGGGNGAVFFRCLTVEAYTN